MSTPGGTIWTGAGHTDIGRVRKINQDAYSIHNAQQLWVLADGMGGHAGGEVASKIAVETIPEFFSSQQDGTPPHSISAAGLETSLVEALEAANHYIIEKASQNHEIKGMGTTVVAVAITHAAGHSQAVIAHTGDSRAYVLRNKELSLLTTDHTLMEERLKLNIITPAQVRTHPLRHVLTKALGIETKAQPTVQTFSLEPTDLLLLCSDGLTKMLTDQEIQALLLKDLSNIDQICHRMVETSNRLGGEDNTTVVIIRSDSDWTVED